MCEVRKPPFDIAWERSELNSLIVIVLESLEKEVNKEYKDSHLEEV